IFINPLAWYHDNSIKLHAGVRVNRIDRESKRVYGVSRPHQPYGEDGIVERYDKLVVATGSSALLPPIDGLRTETGAFRDGVFVFRTLEDCDQIVSYGRRVRKAAVIGGGLLGLEAARGLLNQGLEVHVVHLMGHLMEVQLDPHAGSILKGTLEKMGVHVHLEKSTTAILGDSSVTGLAFKDGSTLDCDMVVISAGIKPNVDVARQAGLAVERGIVVGDDMSCPVDPDVFAVGECAQHRGRVYGLVAPLWEQAQVLADRLTDRNPTAAYVGSKVSTKLKVMGVELAVIGEKEPACETDEVITYAEPSRGVYKKLIIGDGKLKGAILLGDGLSAPSLLQAFDRGTD
ncbi:MAG: NAD(P)/FAD-dependent oxidoreductase, partial [Blastocatellia bacterium]